MKKVFCTRKIIESENSECDDSDVDKDYNPFPNSSFDHTKNINHILPSSQNINYNIENSTKQDKKKTSCSQGSNFEISGSSKYKKLKVLHNTASSASSSSQHQITPTYANHSPEPFTNTTTPPISYQLQHQSTPQNNNFEYDNDQGFKKFISRSITNMKYEIESVNKHLDSFYSLLETINDKLNSNATFSILDNSVFDKYQDDVICIDNNDDLENMEDKLTNDKQYKAHVIVLLTRLMGDSLSETVRKIMQKLFTDNFLAHYSFIGFKGKLTFSNLQHCAVIIEAILKMKKFKEVTIKEIEKPIKGWMAQAPSRIKKNSEKKC